MKGKLETQFSETAQYILKSAEYEAKMYPRQDQRIATEHLLLALFQVHPTLNLLSGWLGIDQDKVKSRVREHTLLVELNSKSTFELSPHLKQVIKHALQEMKTRGHRLLYPQHLLFGLTRVADCTAMTIIRDYGIGVDELQRQTARLMRRDPINLSAQRRALSIYDDMVVESAEFHKWEFKCTLVETATNEILTDFRLNALDLWGLKYGIEDQNKTQFERKLTIDRPNPKYHLVISLAEIQP